MSPLPAGHGEPGIAVLDSHIYVVGGRTHDKGNRMKYVHVYNADKDEWKNGTEFKAHVSGLAACVALMTPAVIAQARSWEQRTKASWEEVDMDSSDDSSVDWSCRVNWIPSSSRTSLRSLSFFLLFNSACWVSDIFSFLGGSHACWQLGVPLNQRCHSGPFSYFSDLTLGTLAPSGNLFSEQMFTLLFVTDRSS